MAVRAMVRLMGAVRIPGRSSQTSSGNQLSIPDR